jgi:hypothetical protein
MKLEAMEGMELRKLGWLMAMLLAGLTRVFAAQQSGEAVPPPTNRLYTTGQVGPAAEWKPTHDFLARVDAACDRSKTADYDQCFMAQMPNAGAPPEAAHITRILYQCLGTVAIVSGFKGVGPVDLARVDYPLRATNATGLLIVNGDPKVLDVDDLKKLDRGEMETTPEFQAVKQRYPDANVWPGDRSGAMWPVAKPLPDGGVEIVIGYPMLNGCQTCTHVGLALFGWDFDAKGKFVKTRYIPLPPPPKKERRGTMPPAPPAP